MKNPAPQAARHPSEDLLVGWTEGSLLPEEGERVIGHLANCEACRELVTDLARELQSTGEHGTQPQGWGCSLVAVVLLTLGSMGLWNWFEGAAGEPPLQVAVANSARGLFEVKRSAPLAPQADQWFAGLALEDDAHLHIVALVGEGELLAVPLDREGHLELRLAGGEQHVLGPYPRDLAPASVGDPIRRIQAALFLVSDDPLDPDWSSAVPARCPGGRAELMPLARDLARQLGARVAVEFFP